MSYDVALRCAHCGSYTLDVNMTSNLAAMWTRAGALLAEWDGRKAREILPGLQRAIDDLLERPEEYTTLQAKNGWGTYENCVAFLSKIRDACARNPKAILEVRH